MDSRTKIKEQLDMTGGKRQLSLRKRRVEVNRNSFNLVIGLGGTGLQALIETKGLINLTCEGADQNVAYLAFDTDERTFNELKSSESTGRATLQADERVLLRTQGLAAVFTLAKINTTHTTNPEYFKWVDERLAPSNNNTGAGGIRQLGRLILMKNYDLVKRAIEDAAKKLSNNAARAGVTGAFLNVYIMAGVSGGTGSGSFIDMPFIVRSVLNSMTGFVKDSNTIYGYLFMPDVNLAQPGFDKKAETPLKRNAYAAFQELDFALGIHDKKQPFDIDYGKGRIFSAGTTDDPIYDYVHLVSATNAAGNIVPDAYAVSMRAISQNILSFVANEQATNADGATTFAIESHYNNINGRIDDFTVANRNNAHRCLKYLAIGSMNYDLPIDDIMMYIASMLFEKMKGMFDDEKMPREADFQKASAQMGLSAEAMLEAFKAHLPQLRVGPMTMQQYRQGADFRQKAESIYASYNSASLSATLDVTASKIADAICTQFDTLMEACFKDTGRGPVHANHLIVRKTLGMKDQISTQTGRLNFPKTHPAQVFTELRDKYEQAKVELDKAKRRDKDEKLVAYNKAGVALVNAYEGWILADRMQAIYSKVNAYITDQNNTLYEFVAGTMTTLKEVFEENAAILTKTSESVTATGRHFSWEPITIPQIDDILKKQFDAIFDDPNNNLLQNFVDDLWKQARVWMQDSNLYDPRAFVSEYVNAKFGEMAEMTIEDVVREMLGPGQTLEATIQNVLKPKIEQGSAPLFHSNSTGMETGGTVMLVSVPEKCPTIFSELQRAFAGQGVILQKSEINNRIYAQTVQCGISLAHYQEIWNAEEVYADNRSAKGLHLVDPHGKFAPEDAVSWRTMATLIPRYRRPEAGVNKAVLELVAEEDARKDDLRRNIDVARRVSLHPAIDLKVVDGAWDVTLVMTDVKVTRDGNTLTILGGGEEHVFTHKPDDWGRAQTVLGAILQRGFAAQYPKAGKTEFNIQQAQSADDDVKKVLDNLSEQYIEQIYQVHAFERELKKYAMLRAFLDEGRRRKEEGEKLLERYLRYSQVYMLKRVERARTTTGRWQACLVAVDAQGARKRIPFADMRETEGYMLEYELFKAYCCRLDAKKVYIDERKSDEELAKQQGAVRRLVESATKQFDTAVDTDDPVCQEYRKSIQKMKSMVDQYRNSGPVFETRNGYASTVSQEVVDFYEYWNNALDIMLSLLDQNNPVDPGWGTLVDDDGDGSSAGGDPFDSIM